MKHLLARFLKDETGATSIEYAMIASGIAVVIIGTVQALGGTVKNTYVSVQNAMP